MILEEMRSCLSKLEPGFWTYGWIPLLGSSGLNVVSRPQVPRSRHFLKFHDFIRFKILKKMRSCLSKLEPGFWTYGWICLLGPSGPNVVFRSQAPRSRHFLRFHILLDLSYDSWENVILFVKTGARVLDLWLDTSSGPKWARCSF